MRKQTISCTTTELEIPELKGKVAVCYHSLILVSRQMGRE